MININNNTAVTDEDRRLIIERALRSYPYIHKMVFPYTTTDPPVAQTERTLSFNDDFYFTEIQGNWQDFAGGGGGLAKLSFFTAWNRNIYRYDTSNPLWSFFLSTEARRLRPLTLRANVDLQFEYFPYLIKRGDKLIVNVVPAFAALADSTLNVAVKGFQLHDNIYVTERVAAQIEESLANAVEWQIFEVEVTDQPEDRGRKTYTVENDKYPRILYGFGATDSQSLLTALPNIELTIVDTSRRLQITDRDIPLEFIAPRIPICSDTHIYYLPTEYYLEPYAKIQFEINNTWFDDAHAGGARIALHTRTI